MTKEEMKIKMEELQAALENNKTADDDEKIKLIERITALESANTGLGEVLRLWLMTRGSMNSVEFFNATAGVAKITVQLLNSQQERPKQ